MFSICYYALGGFLNKQTLELFKLFKTESSVNKHVASPCAERYIFHALGCLFMLLSKTRHILCCSKFKARVEWTRLTFKRENFKSVDEMLRPVNQLKAAVMEPAGTLVHV